MKGFAPKRYNESIGQYRVRREGERRIQLAEERERMMMALPDGAESLLDAAERVYIGRMIK